MLHTHTMIKYETQNEFLLSNLRDVEVHKQQLEQTLSDLKSELDDLHVREKVLLRSAQEQAVGIARESASEVKQAMEVEIEEREAQHSAKVRKLQAEIADKQTEISNITK